MLRALVIAVVLLASAPAGAEPAAMPEEDPAASVGKTPGQPIEIKIVPNEPSVQPLGPDGRPIAIGQRRGKGSGFWGSDTPAPDGRPYRWEHMAIGLGVAACMGALIFYLIRKHGRRASA